MNTPSKNSTAVGGRSKWRFRLLAMGLGLLPFVLVEMGLRIVGVVGQVHDPYAEFGGGVPAFVQDGDVYRTAKAREPYLAAQSFAVDKPAKGLRIFCFGGSTVHGRPYTVETAFPKWLEIELGQRVPERVSEVVNVGGISYGSFRIVPMVREVMAYDPDVIVLATGHNEFLEDRTYDQVKRRGWLRRQVDGLRVVSLGREWMASRQPIVAEDSAEDGQVTTRLDEVNGYASYRRDLEWKAGVLAQFRESLREIVRICQTAGVPLILVQLGSNLRDCPPFKSEHRADLPSVDERVWQELFEEGSRRSVDDPAGALRAYENVAGIDGDYALVQYRIARELDRLGRADEALLRYQRAKDQDICPLRMLTGQHRFLDELAAGSGVNLVDAGRVLAAASPGGVPGFDWYLDHVHPTIGGHQKIAQALLERMLESGLVNVPIERNMDELRRARASHFDLLGSRYLKDGARRLEWLDAWARRAKLTDEVAPRNWSDFVRRGFRRLDFGAMESAMDAFDLALKLAPVEARERLQKQVEVLDEQGRRDAAEWLRVEIMNFVL